MKRFRRTVSGLPPAKFRQRPVAKAAGDAVRLPRRTPDAAIRSRFVALRVYPANRTIPRDEIGVLPQAWLIAEQRIGTAEPTDFWLATLPPRTPLSELVRLAEMRRHVDHDRRELKTALGLDHFEGRSCLVRHPQPTLAGAAHLFLTMLRSTDPKAAGQDRPLRRRARTATRTRPSGRYPPGRHHSFPT